MADETLIYRAEYDNSKLLAGLEVQDRAYEESAKVATKAFEQIGAADTQVVGTAKIAAAMRKDQQDAAAAASVRTAEKEAETLARIKAQAEAEFLRVDAQAAAAEATANATRATRTIEKENAYHQARLQALIGNDEAQEAEARRHAATLITLQEEVGRKSTVATQQIFARMGSMGNQLQGLQAAFMGISMAAGETDNKFGQMIGRAGLMTSGVLGMAQAYQMAQAEIAGMSRTLMVGMPILAAVGVALAVILDHQSKLAELAKHNDWLGDPTKASAVAAAMDQAAKAQEAMARETAAGAVAYGNYAGMLTSTNQGMKDFAEANAKIQAVTGLTRDELIKLYGDLDRARYAFQQLADERLVSQQFALDRALIGAKKDGVEKALELQEVANRQAEASIKNHYAAVLVDTKKTEEEKKRAIAQMGKEMALQEDVNQAMIAQVRAQYANKADKKADTKAAEQVKEYHRMSLQAAKDADDAIAAIDENHYRRAIGKIDSEWAATKRLYTEKKEAAAGNVKALAELDQWYASRQEMLEAQAAAAVTERDNLGIKVYDDYAKQIAALDAQIRESHIQATAGAFQVQRDQVMAAEDAANAQANIAREKWAKDLGDKVAADKMANDLIEKNHAITSAQLAKIAKSEVEAETKARLQGIGQVIAASEGFLNAIAGQNKVILAMSKAAAAANVIVKSMEANATLTAQLGIYAGPAIALNEAATAIELATIAATVIKGFQGGGWTGSGRDDEPAGIVHRNERVVSARETADAGGPAAMESRIRGGGGGGGGSIHFGDTYISLPAGTTPDQARAMGEGYAQGKTEYLRGLKRDIRLISDLRISE